MEPETNASRTNTEPRHRLLAVGPIEGLHPLEESLVLNELLIILFTYLAAPQNYAFLICSRPDKVADFLLNLHEDGVRVDPNRPISSVGVLDISGVM